MPLNMGFCEHSLVCPLHCLKLAAWQAVWVETQTWETSHGMQHLQGCNHPIWFPSACQKQDHCWEVCWGNSDQPRYVGNQWALCCAWKYWLLWCVPEDRLGAPSLWSGQEDPSEAESWENPRLQLSCRRERSLQGSDVWWFQTFSGHGVGSMFSLWLREIRLRKMCTSESVTLACFRALTAKWRRLAKLFSNFWTAFKSLDWPR